MRNPGLEGISVGRKCAPVRWSPIPHLGWVVSGRQPAVEEYPLINWITVSRATRRSTKHEGNS